MLNKFKIAFFGNKVDSDIFKNMFILATGVGSAQIIGLVAMPFLTRMFTPENFGILAVFIATVGIIAPFSTLRYSVSTPLPKQDGIAINILFISLVSVLIISAVITLSFGMFAESIFSFFSITGLVEYWWLIPVVVLVNGFREILESWSTRTKRFKLKAKVNVLQTFSSSGLKLGFGLLSMTSMGLLIGTIVGNILATIVLFKGLYHSIKSKLRYISISRLKFLMVYYLEYPKFRLPSQFLLVFSQQLPLLFLASFFGSDVVGYFSLTSMAISIPFALFGNTTGQAYYAEIAKVGRKNPKKIYEITVSVIRRLFLFSFIPFLILLFASPQLFSVAFGSDWYEAGVYSSIMSFYMLTAFVSAPLANSLNVFENQWLFLKLNIIRLLVLVVIFYGSWLIELEAKETIIAYTTGMSIYYLYMSYYILRTIKNEVLKKNQIGVIDVNK